MPHGKPYIKKYDLTTPHKATFGAICTGRIFGDEIPRLEMVNLIFKNKRQFDFFNNNRNMLKPAFYRGYISSRRTGGLKVDCIQLVESGESCQFDRTSVNVPERDDDPDSSTFIEYTLMPIIGKLPEGKK